MSVYNLLAAAVSGSGVFEIKKRDVSAVNLGVAGTFNGCTVTFTMSPDGVTYFSLPSTTGVFTSAGYVTVTHPMKYIKATITSPGASTSINAGVW